jgi:hypothetical protein
LFFQAPFCNGEAHGEMKTMAERTWQVTGSKINEVLQANKDYELVLTGHSLGGACACLLNIMCHENGNKLVNGRKVRCFAYASPPVFYPLENAKEAVKDCISFINERDCVPFLSVDSVRHAFASLRAIQKHDLRLAQRLKIVSGFSYPDDELVKSVEMATQTRLPPIKGAPLLCIPAEANIWLSLKPNGKYDYTVCDSEMLAKLGIQMHPDMARDHFAPCYEHALYNLEDNL